MSPTHSSFGAYLRAARNTASLSQVQLARKLAVSKQTVSNWESNRYLPPVMHVTRLARVLAVQANKLFMVRATYELARIENEENR